MNFFATHYREYIEREYRSRARRNSSYSLRSFARDLDVPASKLSEVLRGIREFSPKQAGLLAEKLNLIEEEKDFFLALVGINQKKNKALKKQALAHLEKIKAENKYDEISLERFQIISHWHHFAILELVETCDFESKPAWISGRLGLPISTVEEALERLIEFGLLREADGKLIQTQVNLTTPSGVPSHAIKEHHSQILMKADEAIHNVAVDERDISSMTLAFNPEQMDEVRNELKNLRRRLGVSIQKNPKKTRVYCLATLFFPLDNQQNAKV